MIRVDDGDAWLLLGHAQHAALAGEFARHWKNSHFAPPDPFAHILDAVSRHDDSWQEPDSSPSITPEGNPSAFSSELVGTYDAFEEIDLENYLKVRGDATEQAASRDRYSAVLISMHTVNLLTEQADLEGLGEDSRRIHAEFVEGQRRRQAELLAELAAEGWPDQWLRLEALQRGFKFLQACDSFSLYVGVDFGEEGKLRHPQPTRDGGQEVIRFIPLGDGEFALDPYPLDEPNLRLEIPYRRVDKSCTSDLKTFRRAYSDSKVHLRPIFLQPLDFKNEHS